METKARTGITELVQELSGMEFIKQNFPIDIHELLSEEKIRKAAFDGVMKVYRKALSDKRMEEYLNMIQNKQEYPVFQTLKAYQGYVFSLGVEKSVNEKWKHSFDIPEHLKELFNELTAYFGGFSNECKKIKPHHKIILVQGDVGVGKTQLLKLFMMNPTQPFYFRSINKIVAECRIQNELAETIERYSKMLPINGGTKYHFGHSEVGLMIDDAGTEEIVKSFGNQSDVFLDVMLARYSNLQKVDKIHTLITTNLNNQEILDRYGVRFFDRLKEVAVAFNIDENAKSFRGL